METSTITSPANVLESDCRSWFERSARGLGLSPLLVWPFIAWFCALGYLVAVLSNHEQLSLVPAVLTAGVLSTFVSLAHVFSRRELLRISGVCADLVECPRPQFFSWYESELHSLYYSYQNVACSLVGGLLFVLSAWELFQFPHRTVVSNLFLYSNALAAGLLGGPLYFFIWRSTWFVLKMSRMRMKVLVYNHPDRSVKTIGRLVFRYALFYATPAYLLCVFCVELITPHPTVTSAIWIASGALIVFAYFAVPQFHLHRAMVAVKRELLASVSERIDSICRLRFEGNQEDTQRLYRAFQMLMAMEEWPFNTSWVFSLAGTLSVPSLINIVQLVIRWQNHLL